MNQQYHSRGDPKGGKIISNGLNGRRHPLRCSNGVFFGHPTAPRISGAIAFTCLWAFSLEVHQICVDSFCL